MKHSKSTRFASVGAKIVSFLLLAVTLFCLFAAPASALCTMTEKLNTVTLTGDIEMDVCNLAKANVGNKNYEQCMIDIENYCEDFVIDVCRSAGVPESVIPSDQGGVGGFRNALLARGATVVSSPKYGDIILYRIDAISNWCHAALYTAGSGVNTESNDSIQGNMGSDHVVKEANHKYYYTYYKKALEDGRKESIKVTVGNGLSVQYIRPKYSDNKTIANAINAFNRNKTTAKDGQYVINDIHDVTFYCAPCESAQKITLSSKAFSKGEKLNVVGFYNGYVRIVQGDNRTSDRVRVYGCYVKFTDLALQAFNYNKKSDTSIYKITKQAVIRSAPCAEGKALKTVKANSYVQLVYSGDNHVRGHKWGLTTAGEYIYLDSAAKVTLSAPVVSSFKVTGILCFKSLTVKIKSVSNATTYKYEWYTASGKSVNVENSTSLSSSFKGKTNTEYYVKVSAGIKLYNGTVVYSPVKTTNIVKFK